MAMDAAIPLEHSVGEPVRAGKYRTCLRRPTVFRSCTFGKVTHSSDNSLPIPDSGCFGSVYGVLVKILSIA